MTLVPANADLEIEVMMLNKDSGFVHVGQETEIKVESFPFTKYGTIEGQVIHISADVIEDEVQGLVYPVRISMARETVRADGEDFRLAPGMAVTVEIKTGKRRIIEYVLAPVQRYKDESLRER